MFVPVGTMLTGPCAVDDATPEEVATEVAAPVTGTDPLLALTDSVDSGAYAIGVEDVPVGTSVDVAVSEATLVV